MLVSMTERYKPTSSELEILGVLWRLQTATVRQVHSELEKTRPTGYTTVLKLMQIMAGKGLVVRDETDRAHVYRAAVKKEQTQRQMVGDLLERVFQGSASQLVLQALSQKKAGRKELDEIRRMLDEYEGGQR
jgi:BlaI family transcriptional regulator, penicillinase repressor